MDSLLAEGGDPKGVDPILAQEGAPHRRGHLSIPLCIRYPGIKGSTLGRDCSLEGTFHRRQHLPTSLY